MRIVDLLHKQGMNLDIKPKSKAECIDILVNLMDKTGNLNNKEEYKKAILERQKQLKKQALQQQYAKMVSIMIH